MAYRRSFSLGEGTQPYLNNNFDTPRPNCSCARLYNDVYANQNVHQWYNPTCFTASAYGTLGNLGRNNLVGPGYVETDLGVMKETRITERVSLQFRAELFNLFNHPNFNYPGHVRVQRGFGCHQLSVRTSVYGRFDYLARGQRRAQQRRAANAVQLKVHILNLADRSVCSAEFCWLKPRALSGGAELASQKLWGKVSSAA